MYNKITMQGETLMDLTSDTVTEESLMYGYTAHNRSGEQIVGSLEFPLNSKRSAGMVEAGEGYANAVWGTDNLGNPGWQSMENSSGIETHNLDPKSHPTLLSGLERLQRNVDSALSNMSFENNKVNEQLTNMADDLNSVRDSSISKDDVIDDLTIADPNKPLSANMGYELKRLLNGISVLVDEVTKRLNVIADSDDETLDQMSEIVAYIKDNREIIDQFTTAKVNVSDIVNDLDNQSPNKPLSANMGYELKSLIDGITRKNVTSVNNKTGDVLVTISELDGVANTDNVFLGRTTKASEFIPESELDTFVSRNSGAYAVDVGTSTMLLNVLAQKASSASALEILNDYKMSTMKVRSAIDNNRYSEWQELVFKNYVDGLNSQINLAINNMKNNITMISSGLVLTIYFDSVNGNDGNSGTKANPVKTLSGIIAIINARRPPAVNIYSVNDDDILEINQNINFVLQYIYFNTNVKITGNYSVGASAVIFNATTTKDIIFQNASTWTINARGGQCFVVNVNIKHTGTTQSYNVCHLTFNNAMVVLVTITLETSNIIGLRMNNCVLTDISQNVKAWIVSTHATILVGIKSEYSRVTTADNSYIARQ